MSLGQIFPGRLSTLALGGSKEDEREGLYPNWHGRRALQAPRQWQGDGRSSGGGPEGPKASPSNGIWISLSRNHSCSGRADEQRGFVIVIMVYYPYLVYTSWRTARRFGVSPEIGRSTRKIHWATIIRWICNNRFNRRIRFLLSHYCQPNSVFREVQLTLNKTLTLTLTQISIYSTHTRCLRI